MNQVTDSNYQKESSFEVSSWNSQAIMSFWRKTLKNSKPDYDFQGEFFFSGGW